MEEDDIGLWLDEKRCRFLVVADKKLMDDLAPIEFIQFIRAFRHSTTQILYKFRYDGAGRQSFMVWC